MSLIMCLHLCSKMTFRNRLLTEHKPTEFSLTAIWILYLIRECELVPIKYQTRKKKKKTNCFAKTNRITCKLFHMCDKKSKSQIWNNVASEDGHFPFGVTVLTLLGSKKIANFFLQYLMKIEADKYKVYFGYLSVPTKV